VTSQNERQLLVSNQYDFAASKGSGLTSIRIDVLVYVAARSAGARTAGLDVAKSISDLPETK
jgi:hypothetical protein